jgi:hypothetical protein
MVISSKRHAPFAAFLALALIAALTTTTGSAVAGASVPAAAKKIQVVDQGFRYVEGASPADVSAAFILRNPTKLVAVNIRWKATFKDSSGKVLDAVDGETSYLHPGEEGVVASADLSSLRLEREPAQMDVKIREVLEWLRPGDAGTFGPPDLGIDHDELLSFADFRVVQSQYSVTVVGSVTNESDDLLAGYPFVVAVMCALISDGEIVGGVNDQLEFLAPSTPVAFLEPTLEGASADEFRCSPDGPGEHQIVGDDNPQDELTVTDVQVNSTVDGSRVTAAGVVTNTSNQIAIGVNAKFDLLDANGRIIGHTFDKYEIPYLLPGEQIIIGNGSLSQWIDGPPASANGHAAASDFMTTAELRESTGVNAKAPSPLSVSDARLDAGDSSTATAVGTVTNTSAKALTLFVYSEAVGHWDRSASRSWRSRQGAPSTSKGSSPS